MITRRTLLAGLGAVVAAPAIVRASSLMPVKAWLEPVWFPVAGTTTWYSDLEPSFKTLVFGIAPQQTLWSNLWYAAPGPLPHAHKLPEAAPLGIADAHRL